MGKGLPSRGFRAAVLLVGLWCALQSSRVRFSMLSHESTSSTLFVAGDRLKGTITALDKNGALLNLNQDMPGYLHISQIREGGVDKIEDELSVGQEVEVTVRGVRNKEIKVTMLKWDRAKMILLSRGTPLNGTVTEFNRYGALLDLSLDKPGYLHMSGIRGGARVDNIEHELSLGQEVKVTVRNDFSHEVQVTMLTLNEDSSKSLMPGDRLNGTVTGFNKYGAILDLNHDKPGYLHRTQIRGGIVEDIKERFSKGQTVKVTVKKVDRSEIEVTMLKMKGKKPSEFSIGDSVKGRVTGITKTAVFLDVGAMLDAMLVVKKTSDFSEGQELEVTVQTIDSNGIKVVKAAPRER